MHWEISSLNRLYKTNAFAGIKHRVVDEQFVFLATTDTRFDLQLKFMNSPTAHNTHHLPSLPDIARRYAIPEVFLDYARNYRLLNFCGPYYFCAAVTRIIYSGIGKGSLEEEKKVPADVTYWERKICELSICAANRDKVGSSVVDFAREYIRLMKEIDTHLSLRTVLVGHKVTYLGKQ